MSVSVPEMIIPEQICAYLKIIVYLCIRLWKQTYNLKPHDAMWN